MTLAFFSKASQIQIHPSIIHPGDGMPHRLLSLVMFCRWYPGAKVLLMVLPNPVNHGLGSAPLTNSHQDHVQHFWPRESRAKLTLFATVGRVCRSKSIKSWDLTRHDWWQQPSFTPLQWPRVSAPGTALRAPCRYRKCCFLLFWPSSTTIFIARRIPGWDLCPWTCAKRTKGWNIDNRCKHLFQNETQWNRFDAVCTPASSSSASSAGASSFTGS